MCGHVWNTFETGGVCPSCGEHFEHTQCLRCRLFSPHKEWYHDTDPESLPTEALEISE